MELRSVFTVISVYKNKTAEVGAQKFLQNFGYKRRGGNQFWDGEKRLGEPKLFQNLRREPKPYTLCVL